MTAKLKLSRDAALPENASCDHCAESLTQALSDRPGIEQIHRDAEDRLCLHYDTAAWDEPSLARVVRLAGADIQERFQ
ncbi:MAG TPA: heavy-metal-associated domain-containing protein, partial [Ardenticatenaceae bacterium]|nr:heavy-metal-associated domain-containing protein [Ardenticatenaceae bacterium]